MNLNIFLLKKYWLLHKRQAAVIVMSVFIMSFSVINSLLITRSSLREAYHNQLDSFGAMDYGFFNLSDDIILQLKNQDVIDQVGEIIVSGRIGTEDVSVAFGYFKDKTAENLAHYPLEQGRLPQKNGEIAVERSTLASLNLPPIINMEYEFNIYDIDNNFIKTDRFVLVGIIDDMSANVDRRNNDITNADQFLYVSDFPDPLIIISSSDAKNYEKYYTNINITYVNGDRIERDFDLLDEDLQEKLKSHSSQNVGRYTAVINFSDSKEEAAGDEKLSQNSMTKLVKFFAYVCIFISALSVFSIVTAFLPQRIKNLRQLRLCGMSLKGIISLIITEATIFCTVGIFAGISFGCVTHVIILAVKKMVIGTSIYAGFFLERILERHSLNPFIFTVIVSLIAFATGYLKPIFTVSKMTIGSEIIERNIKNKRNPISKAINSGRKIFLQICSTALIITTISIGIICLNSSLERINDDYFFLDKNYQNSYDIEIFRNKFYDINSGANINTETGLSGDDIRLLETCEGTDFVNATLTDMTARMYIKKSEKSANLLSGIDIEAQSNQIEDEFIPDGFETGWDMNKRYYESFGFDDEFLFYSTPIVAVNDDFIHRLDKYITMGKINFDEINNGREVLIIEHSNIDGKVENPFKIGDVINLLDSYPEDEKQLKELRSLYDYLPQKCVTTEVRVGGIVKILNDNKITEMLEVDSLGITHSDVGFNFITSADGYYAMNFPQKNFDNIGIKLKDRKYAEKIENTAVELLSSNKGMTFYALSEQYSEKSKKYAEIVLSFAIMMIMPVVIFAVGYSNTISMHMSLGAENFKILRNLGISKKMLFFRVFFEYTKAIFICGIFSAIICGIVKYFYVRLNEYHTSLLTTEMAMAVTIEKQQALMEKYLDIQQSFLMEFKLWQENFVLPFVTAFSSIFIITIVLLVKNLTMNEKE